jgi:hypothetical protein
MIVDFRLPIGDGLVARAAAFAVRGSSTELKKKPLTAKAAVRATNC